MHPTVQRLKSTETQQVAYLDVWHAGTRQSVHLNLRSTKKDNVRF